MNPKTPYRVCYRKRISEPYRYLYFTQPGEARRKFANLRYSGYIGCVQHWNYQERIWVG